MRGSCPQDEGLSARNERLRLRLKTKIQIQISTVNWSQSALVRLAASEKSARLICSKMTVRGENRIAEMPGFSW